MMLTLSLLLALVSQSSVTVSNSAELAAAAGRASPGTTILLAPGDYRGGVHFQDLHGSEGMPIVIRGANPESPPRFVGGGSSLQFSRVSHLKIRDLEISAAQGNGLNIDDGGAINRPSHHVRIANIAVSDLPPGNHDAIKLSGLDDFIVENCRLARWGGSGIDMVGCHRGRIEGCEFREGGDNGVQTKGGSSEIVVRRCRFIRSGQRAVNIGGSTGFEFFRPQLTAMGSEKYEAKDITVEGCEFTGSVAPIAFVGVDGTTVRYNTFYNPEKWVVRILQETTAVGFVPCRKGVFRDNLIQFQSAQWSAGGFNIGGGTEPGSFRFYRNFWYCSDNPSRSRPQLPTPEEKGVYGVDPGLAPAETGSLRVAPDSPAKEYGATGFLRL